MSALPADEPRVKTASARVNRSAGSRLRAWREQHGYSLVSSLGRFFQRPIATLLTVGVMAIAMALPLGLALLLGNVERLSSSVRESREIGVFLNDGIDGPAAGRLAAELRKRRDVVSVAVHSPEQGLAEFRKTSQLADALDLLEGNPLPWVLRVLPRDDGAAIAAALGSRSEIALLQHDAIWRQRLSSWLAFGERLMWVVGGLLALGVLLVVGNTVRLDIGNRRDEIAVMQQLGATDGFIRRPFIYLGAWYGLAAGLAALSLLAVAGALLQPTLAQLISSYGSGFRLQGPDWREAAVIVSAATAFGWLGAWLASGHHLRQTRPTDL